MIETIADNGVILAYIARGGPLPRQTTFLTPDDCNLRCARNLTGDVRGSHLSRHQAPHI